MSFTATPMFPGDFQDSAARLAASVKPNDAGHGESASDSWQQMLALLAITFEAAEDPSGVVMLHFAGGAAVRLDVECIEAELRDLGAAWGTRAKPVHASED